MQAKIVVDDLNINLFYINGKVQIILTDTSGDVRGKLPQAQSMEITMEQAGAIAFLAISGDDSENNQLVTSMHEIAEEALIGLSPNLRPIP